MRVWSLISVAAAPGTLLNGLALMASEFVFLGPKEL